MKRLIEKMKNAIVCMIIWPQGLTTSVTTMRDARSHSRQKQRLRRTQTIGMTQTKIQADIDNEWPTNRVKEILKRFRDCQVTNPQQMANDQTDKR